MSDFVFPTEKRFSRLTLGRAELVNARFLEVAAASATKLDKDGGTISGNLAVSGNFSTSGTLSVTGNTTLGGTLAVTGAVTLSATLTLSGDPTQPLHAATKAYVDAGDAALSNSISSLNTSLLSTIAAGDALKLSLSGGTMSGAIAMGGNKITGAGAATSTNDVATLANKIHEFAAPTTSLAMNGQRVTGAGNATQPQDLVTLFQLTATAFNSALPSQAGNAGKFVFTDGTNASWVQVYPSQTGNAGKALLTDGTNTYWSFVTLTWVNAPTSFNAVAGNIYSCAAGITVTFPASPVAGNRIGVSTETTAEAAPVTISLSGQSFDASTADIVIARGVTLIFEYFNSAWRLAA